MSGSQTGEELIIGTGEFRGVESINPPQPGAANLIIRPNQKQKKLTSVE